jgi:hypothetical protein
MREGEGDVQYLHRLVSPGKSLASFGLSYRLLNLAGPVNLSSSAFPTLSRTAFPTADDAFTEFADGMYALPSELSGDACTDVGRAFALNVSGVGVGVAESGNRRIGVVIMLRPIPKAPPRDTARGCIRCLRTFMVIC